MNYKSNEYDKLSVRPNNKSIVLLFILISIIFYILLISLFFR